MTLALARCFAIRLVPRRAPTLRLGLNQRSRYSGWAVARSSRGALPRRRGGGGGSRIGGSQEALE